MGFAFACEPRSLSSLLSHTTQAQDSATLVLIKGIKCYSESQQVGPAYEKCPWLFGFYSGNVWLAEHDMMCCTPATTQQLFMSIKHINKGPLSTFSPCTTHSLKSLLKLDKLQCKNMSVSEMSFIFKCQAVPVLHSSPFPQLANVQNWYFIFLDRLL